MVTGQHPARNFSPTDCKELNPANSHGILEADLSLAKLSDETPALANLDCRLMRDPEAEHLAKLCLESQPLESLT